MFFQAVMQIEPLSSKGGFWKDLNTGCTTADILNSTAIEHAGWGAWLRWPLPHSRVSYALELRVILLADCLLRVSHFCSCQV